MSGHVSCGAINVFKRLNIDCTSPAQTLLILVKTVLFSGQSLSLVLRRGIVRAETP